MQTINFDSHWTFRGSGSGRGWGPQTEAVPIHLPHDFSILQQRDPDTPAGASNGFFPGGIGIYEKTFALDPALCGQRLVLQFDGVYMNATVKVNGEIVAQHPYGYTSFHCDITDHVFQDRDNTITVTVNNSALPNTRWYSGSGIYRHVWLLAGGPVHIAPWGVFVSTPIVAAAESAVQVVTTLQTHGGITDPCRLRTAVVDPDGNTVATADTELRGELQGSSWTQSLAVRDAQLWSLKSPALYTVVSQVLCGEAVLDSVTTSFGIRAVTIDAVHGLRLNGEPLLLKGGCVHHDCGPLGAASYDRAEERKVELLQASGFNAVRCAHNPPAPAFLDACDRLGMLVINEAFDCWLEGKNANDYGFSFAAWWQEDLASMVRRDRNHPSIIMWSTGNEILERDGRNDGYRYARELAQFVRQLDPTRAVTNGLCGLWYDPETSGLAANVAVQTEEDGDAWGTLTAAFAEPLDVVGYNYLLHRYAEDGEKFPGRVICGTETFPKDAFAYWEATERLPHVIGDFVWTSLDYLGEAGIGHVWHKGETGFLGEYPWHQANCGDIDICGFKRPQSYYRDCVWGIAKEPYLAVYKPEHHGTDPVISAWGWPDVVHSWTWPGWEGKPTTVEVYSMDDDVELLLNGSSLGRQPAGREQQYRAVFEVMYQPGTLEAVAHRGGQEVSRTQLRTAGPGVRLQLTPDRSSLRAEYGDLCFVTVELLDAAGQRVDNADNPVFFTASGAGRVAAVANSDPMSVEMYVGSQRRLHQGRSLIVLLASGEPGSLCLHAAIDGVPAAQLELAVE